MSVDLNHTAQEYAERWQRAEERARRVEAVTATLRAALEMIEPSLLHHPATDQVTLREQMRNAMATARTALSASPDEALRVVRELLRVLNMAVDPPHDSEVIAALAAARRLFGEEQG